ncbi:preprotein translocase subunit SecE [Anaerobranca californiensis DSM 14826]|jgi:preprotein translocase subunit SecE|uniref:Protein translocase subunit SecE n=1 Tax=Anaerobranca californiensis DSM 14826 TaxID=1120989 RepID=A0A1M6RFZ9_9FIRM|nr:preprotein translocase subunit SecE [Anaerobranca californiensis]SHK31382.1 preprotein translocase subunit SecE [Anaerobranca californiensis DSM 14826]
MGFFAKVQKFFKEVKNELKKVQWPSKKELTSYTILVIGIIVIASLLIFIIDNGFTGILNLIF